MNGDKAVVSSVHGMVAAAQPLAAFAGAGVLRDGGNAFDAAVATAAALNVVEPFMSGLAGLGMATCYSAKEKRIRCLDFVPAVPHSFDATKCTKEDLFIGPKASGVPGNLAGWHRLATDYGTVDFADLLAPAIKLARDGFPVSGGIPTITPEYWQLRSRDPEWVRVYTPGNKDIPHNWILQQPDLANSLESIARDGVAAFYQGPLGQRVVDHLRSIGGFLNMADLESVETHWMEPLQAHYRGLDVHSLAPPSEAFQFLLTLAILQRCNIGDYEQNGPDHLDCIIRAVRLAAEQRIQNNHAPAEVIAELLTGTSLDQLCERHDKGAGIDGRVQQWKAITDPDLVGRREHTTSLSTADRDGNMVCLTQSLGSIYGSGVVVPGTGICLNNFLNWTDLDPESPNTVGPGGRMAMCLAPSISTRHGQPVLSLGTPGSYGILHTQVQAMVHYLDYDLSLDAAIDAPRARLWDGNLVHVESRVDSETIETLRQRGHSVSEIAPYTRVVGGIQAIARDPATGALTGAADSRRDGYAAAP